MKSYRDVLILCGMILTMVGMSGCSLSEELGNSGQSTEENIEEKTNQSSKTEVIENVQRADESTSNSSLISQSEMNLKQIQTGDYSSLQGEWKEVAASINRHDSKGDVWSVPEQYSILKIIENKIVTSWVHLEDNTLSEINSEEKIDLTYTEEEDTLIANSTNGSGVTWGIYFYPKGAKMLNWGENLPSTIDEEKEQIIFRTSNNSYVQVYQKGKEDEVSNQPAVISNGMNLNELETGNYTSVNGTWVNGLGSTIIVEDGTIKFTDITGFGESGIVSGFQVNVPEFNDSDGSPKIVEGIGGMDTPRYNQKLTSYNDNGIVTLESVFINAKLCISFLPQNSMGDLWDAESTPEKIVAVVTQNNPTAVPNERVYYRSE